MRESLHSHSPKAKNHANRTLQHERLENRELLSTVSPMTAPDDLTESAVALVATETPAENACLVEMNLETQQVQAAPEAVSATSTAKTIVVNTMDDTVNSDRYTSLREAIQNAQSGAVITFAKSLQGKSIVLSSELVISKAITIDASSLYYTQAGKPGLTLYMTSSNESSIKVDCTGDVSIKGLNFTAVSKNNTGGIYWTTKKANITVEDCRFYNMAFACTAPSSAKNTTTIISNCEFTNISTCALSNEAGIMGVKNSAFEYCKLCIQNANGNTAVVRTNFMWNTSVFYNYGGRLDVSYCKFIQNSGGYLFNNLQNGTVLLMNSLAANNTPGTDQAAFMNTSGYFLIVNITSATNHKTFINKGTMYVYNSVCTSSSTGTIVRKNCKTLSEANLDDQYRPTINSSCLNAGDNSIYEGSESLDLAGNKRILYNTVDVGCYEYFLFISDSMTSGKTKIEWGDSGAASYTVKYRVKGTEKWTAKTVKNTSQLMVSLKCNVLYEVKVVPEGVSEEYIPPLDAWSLAKPTVKLISKSDDTLTFQVSNMAPPLADIDPRLVIAENGGTVAMKLKETTSETAWALQSCSGTYTFYNNVLTLKGLSSNTKYTFQFAQIISDLISGGLSSFVNVSGATTKTCYNTPTIKSLSATSKGVTVNWNTVYGKGSNTAAQKYTIQYAVKGTNKWKTATSSATGISYTVKNLKPGTTYEFRICATKDSMFMTSLYSSVKNATPNY